MPTKGSRGRPKTHWADVLRVRIWYKVVRQFTGLSDYALDLKFASPGEEPRSPADRKRVFEKIRRNGQVPSRGTHWRSEYDLIGAVNDFLPGSKEIFEADFWDLLKAPPATLQETHDRLENCLKDYGFKRMDWAPLLGRISQDVGHPVDPLSAYNGSLKVSLRLLDTLDQLRLLALLTREADLAGNAEITESTRNFFDQYLDKFFSAYFPHQEAITLYHMAIEQYCFGQRAVHYSEADLRSFLESRVTWLIRPDDLP